MLNELVDHIPDIDPLCGEELLQLGRCHGSQSTQAGGQLHIAEGTDRALEDGGLKRGWVTWGEKGCVWKLLSSMQSYCHL